MRYELIFIFDMLGIFPLPAGSYKLESFDPDISNLSLQVEHKPDVDHKANGQKRTPAADKSEITIIFSAKKPQSVDSWGMLLGDAEWFPGALPPQKVYEKINDIIAKIRARGYPHVALPDFSLQSFSEYHILIVEEKLPARHLVTCETYPEVSVRPTDPCFLIQDVELAKSICEDRPLEFHIRLYLDGWRYLCEQDYRSAQISFANAAEAIAIEAFLYTKTKSGVHFKKNEILSYNKNNHYKKRYKQANKFMRQAGFTFNIDVNEKYKIIFHHRNEAMHGGDIKLSIQEIGPVKEAVGDLINWLNELRAYTFSS